MGLAVLAIACDAGQPKPVAGGSTEDFNGNPDSPACETVSRVELDDTSPIGFAPRAALDLIEGNYALGITWNHPCASDLACPNSACGDGAVPLVSPFAGTETVLRIEIQATGEAARVSFDEMNNVESSCPEAMDIPVLVRLTTDDGALNEHFASQARADNPNGAQVFVDRPVEQFQGALATSVEAGGSVEISLSAQQLREDIHFGAELRVGGAAGYSDAPIVRTFLTDSEGCAQDLPRDSVLVEP